MADQAPSIGRIVHYVVHSGSGVEHRAALITEVHDDVVVRLCVYGLEAIHFVAYVAFDASAQTLGSWHWPEYVK